MSEVLGVYVVHNDLAVECLYEFTTEVFDALVPTLNDYKIFLEKSFSWKHSNACGGQSRGLSADTLDSKDG